MPAKRVWPPGAIDYLCARSKQESMCYRMVAEELTILFSMRRVNKWTVRDKIRQLDQPKPSHNKPDVSEDIIAKRKMGKRNHEIAAEMGMTYNQVNYHIGILLRRGLLDAQSPGRSAPTLEWIRLGH